LKGGVTKLLYKLKFAAAWRSGGMGEIRAVFSLPEGAKCPKKRGEWFTIIGLLVDL
jgi:hypothetical protein